MPRRSGIVLAGGRGERLGLGVPKARVRIGEHTLLDRAVATLESVCTEVVVVTPATLDPGPTHARRVHDAAGHAGPLAGLVAGLEACAGEPCAVLGVDFPLVTSAWIEAVCAPLDPERAAAVVPRPEGIPQPLVAAYAVAAAPRLRAALEAGVTSLRGGLESLSVMWLDDAALALLPGGAAALLNVNTPADLEAARRALATVTERTPGRTP